MRYRKHEKKPDHRIGRYSLDIGVKDWFGNQLRIGYPMELLDEDLYVFLESLGKLLRRYKVKNVFALLTNFKAINNFSLYAEKIFQLKEDANAVIKEHSNFQKIVSYS